MTPEQQQFMKILRSSLFTGESISLSDEIITEATQQAVLPLIATNEDVYPIISNNVRVAYEQKEMGDALAGIPYVVLKGLASAIYYPEPLRRTLGDIDIIVRPENFPAAYQALKAAGYTTTDLVDGQDRHVHFHKNGFVIELHRTYSELNTRAAEQLLDGWVYSNIPSAIMGEVQGQTFSMLPELFNGLTLLAHISQHLEGGLGLRQIIDWVMYVHCCLPDEKWPSFQDKTDQLGLTRLAKVTARLGQLYLGLDSTITWCRDIDDSIAGELLDYIFECGNFGNKAPMNNTVTMVLSHGKGVRGFFRNLQKRGEANWKTYQMHQWFKPLCWAYQAVRYASKGLKRENALAELNKDLAASKRRNKLMKALGATQLAVRNTDRKKRHSRQ